MLLNRSTRNVVFNTALVLIGVYLASYKVLSFVLRLFGVYQLSSGIVRFKMDLLILFCI